MAVYSWCDFCLEKQRKKVIYRSPSYYKAPLSHSKYPCAARNALLRGLCRCLLYWNVQPRARAPPLHIKFLH